MQAKYVKTRVVLESVVIPSTGLGSLDGKDLEDRTPVLDSYSSQHGGAFPPPPGSKPADFVLFLLTTLTTLLVH